MMEAVPPSPPEGPTPSHDHCCHNKDDEKRMPMWVFWIALMWMLLLGGLFFAYESSAAMRAALPRRYGPLPGEIVWFGAAGGLLVSFAGIFAHNRDWDPSFSLWHAVRPLIGAITGSIGCLLLLALTELTVKGNATPGHTGTVNATTFDATAFVFGYGEQAFRDLIKSLTTILLRPGQPAAQSTAASSGPPTTTSGQPPSRSA